LRALRYGEAHGMLDALMASIGRSQPR